MPDPIYYDEDHGGSVNEMMHAVTSFSLMVFGAFASRGIGSFSQSSTVAGNVVVVNGTKYYGLTLAEAQQVESALVAAQVARQQGLTLPRLDGAISALITRSALAGMQE